MQFTTDINHKAVVADLEGAPVRMKVGTVQAMRRVVALLHRHVATQKLTGSPLNYRTRNLTRAMFHEVNANASAGDIVGRVGFDIKKAVYARAVTEGGTIKPKHGEFLTIPVGEALTPNGVPRISAREFIEKTEYRSQSLQGVGLGAEGWRGFTSSFVNKNRTAIMGVRKSGSVEPVFLLRRQVVLPKRDVLGESLRDLDSTILVELRSAATLAMRAGSGRDARGFSLPE